MPYAHMTDSANAPTSEHSLDDIFNALAGWPDLEQTLLDWQHRQQTRSRPVQRELSEDFLVRAMKHPDETFREIAAEAGDWSHDVMRLAISDQCESVRSIAARSTQTPPEALAIAANDTSDLVRLFVAANRATPIQALQTMMRDPDHTVRRAAVLQGRFSCRVLSRLASSDDAVILAAVAQAFQTSPATLHRLATRAPSLALWKALATNPRTENRTLALIPAEPRAHLHTPLLKHPLASDELCRRLARGYLDQPDAPMRLAGLALMFRGSVKVLAWGQGRMHRNVPMFAQPSDVVIWLADGADLSTTVPYALDEQNPEWLRWFILSRAELSQEVWARLANDPHDRVRKRAHNRVAKAPTVERPKP